MLSNLLLHSPTPKFNKKKLLILEDYCKQFRPCFQFNQRQEITAIEKSPDNPCYSETDSVAMRSEIRRNLMLKFFLRN